MKLDLNNRLSAATPSPQPRESGPSSRIPETRESNLSDAAPPESTAIPHDILFTVKNLPFPVAFLDKDMRYQSVSQTFADAVGTAQHALIGSYHPSRCPGFPRDWADVFDTSPTEAASSPRQEVFLRGEGERAFIPWKATLWRNAAGAASGVLLSLGEERQEDGAGQNQNAKNEEMFGRMTRKMAHDFNNILTVVRSGLELTMMSDHLKLNADDLKLMRTLIQSTDHGVAITSKLLAVGRNHSLEPGSVDLRQLLVAIVNETELKVPPGTSVTFQDCPGRWSCVIDKQQFKNALAAIVANAIEAMPSGGRLHFKLENSDTSELRFSVTDSGHGMDAVTLEHAKDAFFTTKHGIIHAGLGLNIADGFFVRSGGGIQIESSPGSGCKVIARLPFAQFAWPVDGVGDVRF